MLNRDLINKILSDLPDISDAGRQVLEGDGYDAVIDILKSLRSLSFPVVILESRSSGTIDIIDGTLDTYTQSLWVMGQLGRNDDEAALYRNMFALCKKIITLMLAAKSSGKSELQEWNHNHISYMKRYGGPNSRGYELVFTFQDNISLYNG